MGKGIKMKTKVMLLAVVLMISGLVALPVGAVQTSDMGCGGSKTACGEQKNSDQKECDGEKKTRM